MAEAGPGVKPVKLAILLCDTPVLAVLESRGTYLDIFRDQLRLSNPDTSFHFTLDGFDVVSAQEYPDLDAGYSGVLISGSKYSACENESWIERLVGWVAETAEKRADIKLIGICFGQQIIARAMGGECVPNHRGWEVGSTDIELTDVGKVIFDTDKASIPIQQMHRDHVPSVPPTFHLLGSSPKAPVQGLVRFHPTSSSPSVGAASIHIFAVQGHPEFTTDIVNAIIDVRERNGIMDADVVREGRKRAAQGHEGIGIIGRAIWRALGVNLKT